ncbi:MAG TPA: hypothetical protein DCF72_10400 [Gammaproteobacteria bacterium]|nr:hypothetical protein [Gammaproteobacteria bacterium]
MIAAHGVQLLNPFSIHRTRKIHNTIIKRFDDCKIVNRRRMDGQHLNRKIASLCTRHTAMNSIIASH